MKKRSVALEYKLGDSRAPRVLLKAEDEFAKIMEQLAKKHGITIYQDKYLVDALYALPEGAEISADLYKAVAEVIAFCYNLDGRLKKTE